MSDVPIVFARHPLVYLVEAADDICYETMDIEDAHKLKILDTQTTFDLLLGFFDHEKDADFYQKKTEIFKEVTDVNEQVAYLRASVIGKLILKQLRFLFRITIQFWKEHLPKFNLRIAGC